MLILVVEDQHRIEFETGYGLESDLTDLICFRIQQDYMIPFAKENQFDVALINGVKAVNDKLNSTNSMDEVVTETLPEETTEETTEENFISEPEVATFSFNAFVVIANSIFSLLFLFVITLAMLGGDFQQGKKTKEVAATALFRNAWYKSFWFTALFLLIGALVMMDLFSFVFQQADFPFYVSIIAFYISWCVFVHVYYFIILPVKIAQSPLSTPHLQHEQRAEANKYLKRFSWVFPLPFLILFSLWNQSRLRKLRNILLTCDCGTVMKKKSEVEDDLFLTNVQVKEERVKSIDYDVWVCTTCQKQRVLPYQDFTSAILQCDKCSGRTMLKTGSEVVEQASYSSGGYGYKIYDCQNCAHQTKVKYTIPKKTQSSSSSGSSGGSSSSSSSGGGSSGGGGSGSSW